MKKVMTMLAVLSLATMVAVPSFAAVDLKGKWGLGYQRPEAPIGARIWLSEKMGLDLGLGFVSSDNNPTGESQTEYAVDLGLPIVLASAGSANFYVRPGFGYASSKDYDYTTPPVKAVDATDFWVTGDLGVEYFATDNFSLQVAHGLIYNSHDTDLTGGQKTSTFGTEAFGISSIGFHYYFGGSK